MKNAILFICIVLAMCSCSEADSVYVCTGPYSVAYHQRIDCKGLKRCGSEIEKISRQDAVKEGRRPCRICGE